MCQCVCGCVCSFFVFFLLAMHQYDSSRELFLITSGVIIKLFDCLFFQQADKFSSARFPHIHTNMAVMNTRGASRVQLARRVLRVTSFRRFERSWQTSFRVINGLGVTGRGGSQRWSEGNEGCAEVSGDPFP